MATSINRKKCAVDDDCKQAAVAHCEGCSDAFCTKHFIDHRRLLGDEMNILFNDYNSLKNTLNQQTSPPDSHPLTKQIDDWEKESIDKIRHRAEELRQQLIQSTQAHANDLSKKIQQLCERLNEGRRNDDFIEADLRRWKKILDSIKLDQALPTTVVIHQREKNPLVQNITVGLFKIKKDLFNRVFDNKVRIEEDGHVAIHDDSTGNTEIRGINEYTSGSYKIRLCIEQSSDSWIFIGINSKSTPLCSSYSAQSTYGWSSDNYTYLNGESCLNNSYSRIEMNKNDILSLLIDCNSCKVWMLNERTNVKHELTVNIDCCPFPWQLHVILREPNSCVRILATP